MSIDQAASTQSSSLVELVPDRLFVVGGQVPLDGRASWAPAAATGYQPSNAFVLLGETPLIVDTGVEYVEAGVLSGLRTLLAPGASVEVFLSRAQLDCIGNLGTIASTYEIADVFTGGIPNPFDSFDDAPSAGSTAKPQLKVHRSPEECRLEIYNPSLRLLATSWGYDPETRALFTSDSFTHGTSRTADALPVIDSLDDDDTTQHDVREHLLATFWWLLYADKSGIAGSIRAFFETHPVEIVAPDRGCVLKGTDVVARHLDMLLAALAEAPEEALCR
jgi:hypothetical protein